MQKYLRVKKKKLVVLDSELNTILDSDIKLSDEVFNYFLTLFNKIYNEKEILEKEIVSVEEINKYLKDKKEEVVVVQHEVSTEESQLWTIIEELGLQLEKVENELATIKG